MGKAEVKPTKVKIENRITELLAQRLALSEEKKTIEAALKDVNIDLLGTMLANKIPKFEALGHKMAVRNGENRYIKRDKLITELIDREIDADVAFDIVNKVEDVTPYQYVDVRKAKATKDGEETE